MTLSVDFSDLAVGEAVSFGHYEQDADETNGKEPIEWTVLDINDEKVTLISRYILDRQFYNSPNTKSDWENCSLRYWLNHDFLKAAFTKGEQSLMETATVPADPNPEYTSVDPGNETQDKVYLLSIDEATRYMSSDFARVAESTPWAQKNGASEGAGSWWLRTPGKQDDYAAYVNSVGTIDADGDIIHYKSVRKAGESVRPVIVLRMPSGNAES